MIVTPCLPARLAGAIAVLTALGAVAPRPPARYGQFSAATDVVQVYVSVTDQSGHAVEGLTAEDFEVSEDGARQPVTVFSAGQLPLSLAVVLDRSFSMAGEPLRTARAGAGRIVEEASRDDRIAVVALGSGVETLAPFGAAPSVAREAIEGLQPWGTTPLGQAVESALDALAGQHGRQAVVLFTDGRGRYDPADRTELLARVRRSEVLVYPVVVGRADVDLLTELAALSGGHAVRVKDQREGERAASALTAELRQQYLIGYEPPAVGAGTAGWHVIHVAVPGTKDAVVRARAGYYRRGPAGASLGTLPASK